MGLHLAGFDVVGGDIQPQPRYPFEFHQADALAYPLDGFDFIWASPVCKGYTRARMIHGHKESYPLNQIPMVRERLQALSIPYAIENVVGAPLINPFTLCGLMFGLKVLRHRHFEANFLVSLPPHPRHVGTTNSHRGMGKGGDYVCVAGHNFLMAEARIAMGIDWMVQSEMSQAIPPAYSEFIARQVITA